MDLSEFGDFSEEEHPLLTPAEARYAALTYLSLGWAVTAGPGLDVLGVCSCRAGVECGNPGKHAHAGWGNKTRRTMTEAQVERYWADDNKVWQSRPVDQVFIVPYLSGLVVADVDVMDVWESLDPSVRPLTLFQKSGSGRGGHFLYKYDWDMKEENPPRLPGSLPDRCGELKFRGIIVGAPCPHKSGGRYEWDNWGTPVADAPAGLLERGGGGLESHVDWGDLIGTKRGENSWLDWMFQSEFAGVERAGDATHARPRVLFAVAAQMAKWIAAGWVTEDFVVTKLMDASERNGALETYGEDDMLRQIRNGIEAGLAESKS